MEPDATIAIAFNRDEVNGKTQTPSMTQVRAVFQTACEEWMKYAGVTFKIIVPTEDPETTWSTVDTVYKANVRVTFQGAPNTYTSALGTQSIDPAVFAPGRPSMVLAGVGDNPPRDLLRIVVHELGHVLGFEHEHQHPFYLCSAEIDADMICRTWGLSPREFNANFKALDPSYSFSCDAAIDAQSVMGYSLDQRFFRSGAQSPCFATPGDRLSERDQRCVGKVYPKDKEGRAARYAERLVALESRQGSAMEAAHFAWTRMSARKGKERLPESVK
ncbi:MAG: hypothetical protein IPJ19_07120 [Planctomycetes bacterium]|nr:hypothetical protein [Planctomycetota bacterium]